MREIAWSLSASLPFSKTKIVATDGASLPRALQNQDIHNKCLLRLPLKLPYELLMERVASSAFFPTERSIQTRYGVRCPLRLFLKLTDGRYMDCLSFLQKLK